MKAVATLRLGRSSVCIAALLSASAAASNLSIGDIAQLEGSTPGAIGRTDFVFALTLDEAAPTAVDVTYEVLAGGGPFPADLAVDLDLSSVTYAVTIPQGETSATLTIPVVPDTEFEQGEYFRVELTDAVGAAILDFRGIGTIVNDDVYLSVTTGHALYEGNDNSADCIFAVGVRGCAPLPCTPGLDIQVDYAAAESLPSSALAGVDFEAISGTLTFSAGLPANDIAIAVPVYGDLVFEPNERFVLELQTVTNATGTGMSGYCDILNDDPRFTVASFSNAEGSSGTTSFDVPVWLVDCLDPDDCYDRDLTVELYTTGVSATGGTDCAEPGTDYIESSSLLTIPAGSSSAFAEITVCGDLAYESNESFGVQLRNATNDSILGTGSALVTILDDDSVPEVTIDDASALEGDAGESPSLVFTVSLSWTSFQSIRIDWSTADGTAEAGSDYLQGDGYVLLLPGELSDQFALTLIGDDDVEGDESFSVELNLDANPGVATLQDASAEGTIVDDDGVAAVALTVTVNGYDANTPPGPSLVVGSTLVLGYAVSNVGDLVLDAVDLIDDNGTTGDDSDDVVPIYQSGDTNGSGYLDPGETFVFSIEAGVAEGTFARTATVTADPLIGGPSATDSDTVHFVGEVALFADGFESSDTSAWSAVAP